MASTYVNNLRLNEMATGDGSGTWGTTTNTNLELIGQALGYGTRAIANASTDNITIADGASDSDRAMYLKLTGGGQACTVTLLPNTASKVWMLENATSYTLTFTCGSGANVAILAGETKIIATDGGGSGGIVYDVLTDVNLAGTTKTAALTNAGALSNQGTVTVGVDDTGYDVKFFGATSGAYMLWDESADDLKLVGAAGFTVAGDIDIDGTANLDVVDIDGATQADGTITVGVDDTGYDVKFFGATSGAYMLWDESADDLKLVGAAGLTVAGDADIDGTTNLDAVDIDGAVQADGTITVGVDDTGYDVKFFGATASAYMLWDESADDLILAGAARVVVPASGLVIASTAVSSTAAELNLLDGLDRGSILYGNASSATTVLGQGSADQVLTSDGTDISWADAAGGVDGLTGLVENNSIWLGDDPSSTTDSASYNVALGTTALDAITTGDGNAAIGYGALGVNTTGSENSALGKGALDANIEGDGNTAVGLDALGGNTADANTAVGSNASRLNTTGTRNTSVGRKAMEDNTEGNDNVGIGYAALETNTDADNNTAVGSYALTANTTGAGNVAIGKDALDSNTTGSSNTAIGTDALQAATTRTQLVAVGFEAGKLTEGVNANNSVFVGYQAGAAVTNAGNLICIGSGAADTETTGNDSIYIGKVSNGGASASNSQNTTLGNETMAGASAGYGNTAIGHSALNDHTSGVNNCCVGREAGDKITSGGNNVCIGYDAGSDAMESITTDSNNVIIGNNSIDNAEVKVDWTVGSDQRDKTDIETLPDNAGLNFVNQMRPVTYVWDNRSNYYKPTDENFGERDHSKKSTTKQVGFIAQEVKAIEESIGWTDDHIVNTSNEQSYKLMYSQVIPMLTKAIQELSAKVEELENKGE